MYHIVKAVTHEVMSQEYEEREDAQLQIDMNPEKYKNCSVVYCGDAK